MGSIVFHGLSRSTNELNERVERGMSALHTLGVKDGECVLILLRNDMAFLEAAIAVGQLGAYPVPVNWHAKTSEVRAVAEDCNAKFAIVHESLLREHQENLPPNLDVIVVLEKSSTPPAGLSDWGTLVAEHPRFSKDVSKSRGVLVYTSGTTSDPKAIDRLPLSPDQEQEMFRSLMRTYGFRSGMRALVCGPLYHAMTYSYCRTALAVMGDDGALFLEARFDAEKLLEMIERHRITHLLMVPVMFYRLLKLDQGIRGKRDVSSIECVVHSAAPCPQEVKKAMIDWWGPVLQEFYGASETGPVTLITSEEYLERPGSVGRAQDGSIVSIVDENGDSLPVLEVGEIAALNTYYPDFTYRNRVEEREKLDRNGLIATGDIGYLDQDGYLFLLDRKKNMVITGGVNVYPAEIEEHILTLDAIKDCAVFGIPDEEFGESMAAHIELLPCATLTEDEVAAYLRTRLAGYKVPKVIRFEASLPREDNGKIYKRRLAQPYWQDAGRKI